MGCLLARRFAGRVPSVQTVMQPVQCRILNVGPDPDAHRLLLELAQNEAGILLQQIEFGSTALEILKQLPESDLPHIVTIPHRLAILTSQDFISAMQSDERLSAIPILVWGPRIEPWEMGELYKAGAISVLLGNFDATHVDAVRQFCYSRTSLKSVVTVNPVEVVTIPRPPENDGQNVRNVRLGTLFLWTSSTSSAFWVWSFVQARASYTLIDLAPVPIYTSLATAGLFLIFQHAKRRVSTE